MNATTIYLKIAMVLSRHTSIIIVVSSHGVGLSSTLANLEVETLNTLVILGVPQVSISGPTVYNGIEIERMTLNRRS